MVYIFGLNMLNVNNHGLRIISFFNIFYWEKVPLISQFVYKSLLLKTLFLTNNIFTLT